MGDQGEPLLYRITFTYLDGSTMAVAAATDRGPFKAVYLASARLKTVFGRQPIEVACADAGPVPVDDRNVPMLGDVLIDRQEW